jgi:sulfatase modifying factor 1
VRVRLATLTLRINMSKIILPVVGITLLVTMGASSLYLAQQVIARDIRAKSKVTPLQHLAMPTPNNVRLQETKSCPSDMKRVVGEYCAELVHTCIKERAKDPHVKNPGKTPAVCEEFARTSRCLSKRTKHMDFCIDVYERTEEVSDLPRVYMSWTNAKASCEIEGKRLCSTNEWTKAAEGPNNHPLAYNDGYTRDKKVCNIDRPWHDANTTPFEKLDKRVPVGSMKGCKSDYGIYDMAGNVDEHVLNENGSYHHEPWVSTLMGGHYAGVRNTTRAMTTSHSPDFAWYAHGWRCCSDVK